MKRLLIILFCAVTTLNSLAAGISYTREDSLFVCQVLREAVRTKNTSTLYFARKFLNQPYVAHTLEVGDPEQLVVNTRELDCTTLVENVLALALCAQQGKTSFSDFTSTLRQLRYRGGKLDGYPSRLHYFSDWILDNQQMGYVQEISAPNPPFTAVQTLNVNYMSQHPTAYVALKKHPEFVPVIASQEQKLTGQKFRYIPKSQVCKINTRNMRKAVKDGDVICITTNRRGLEIAHLGFAVWKADGLHLLNASMIHKKVEEDPVLFRDYIRHRTSDTGIRIVRLKTKNSKL
jgi:hypothetical protein